MTVSKNSAVDSAVALAAGTAFLYCASTAYYHGYCITLKLDVDVLDRNFHQTLYEGFVLILTETFIVLFFAFYALSWFFYSHAVLPDLEKVLKKGTKQKRQFLRVKRFFRGKQRDSPQVVAAKRHAVRVGIAMGSLIIFMMFLAFFEREGKQRAIDRLQEVRDGAFQTSSLITVSSDGEHRELVFLICGARNCAGLDPSTMQVRYFPQNGHAFHLDGLHHVGPEESSFEHPDDRPLKKSVL